MGSSRSAKPATVLAASGSRSSGSFASRDSSSRHAFGQSIGCRYCHAWGHMLLDYAKKKQADLRRQQSASAAAATPSAGSNTIEMFDDIAATPAPAVLPSAHGPQCLWHSLCGSSRSPSLEAPLHRLDMPPQPPLRCLPRLTALVFLGPPGSFTPVPLFMPHAHPCGSHFIYLLHMDLHSLCLTTEPLPPLAGFLFSLFYIFLSCL